MRRSRFFKVMRVVSIGLVAVTAVTLVTMGLWNVLMPSIFAVREISFWQALGLLLLSKILFGGFRPGRGGSPRWRKRMMERWEQMTPEEREQFKQGIRQGCGPRRQTEAQA